MASSLSQARGYHSVYGNEHFLSFYPPNQRQFCEWGWFQFEPKSGFACEGQIKVRHNYWTHLASPTLDRSFITGEPVTSLRYPLIIAADGACRGNGTSYPLSAVGVWFGKGNGNLGNSYNISQVTVDASSLQAELSAATMALHQYENIVAEGQKGRDGVIIIKSDSQEVVRGITERFLNFQDLDDDWINRSGKPLVHRAGWENLLKSVLATEAKGTRVLFWWVRREENLLADALANEAYLDEQDPDKYLDLADAEEEYAQEREDWLDDHVMHYDYADDYGYTDGGEYSDEGEDSDVGAYRDEYDEDALEYDSDAVEFDHEDDQGEVDDYGDVDDWGHDVW